MIKYKINLISFKIKNNKLIMNKNKIKFCSYFLINQFD